MEPPTLQLCTRQNPLFCSLYILYRLSYSEPTKNGFWLVKVWCEVHNLKVDILFGSDCGLGEDLLIIGF